MKKSKGGKGKSIKQWCGYIHKWAKRKGFWNPKPSKQMVLLNIIGEVSEANEELRNKKWDYYTDDKGKPQGEIIELADCVIRIMDYFESQHWDLEYFIKTKMKFNETRPYKHGNKKY